MPAARPSRSSTEARSSSTPVAPSIASMRATTPSTRSPRASIVCRGSASASSRAAKALTRSSGVGTFDLAAQVGDCGAQLLELGERRSVDVRLLLRRHLVEHALDSRDVACEVCRPGLQRSERFLDTARDALEALGERRDGRPRCAASGRGSTRSASRAPRLARRFPRAAGSTGPCEPGRRRPPAGARRTAPRRGAEGTGAGPGAGRGEMAMDAAGSDHCSARALASSRRVIAPWPTRICPSGCCVRSCSAVAFASCSASTNPRDSRMSPIRRFATVSLRGTALTVRSNGSQEIGRGGKR